MFFHPRYLVFHTSVTKSSGDEEPTSMTHDRLPSMQVDLYDGSRMTSREVSLMEEEHRELERLTDKIGRRIMGSVGRLS